MTLNNKASRPTVSFHFESSTVTSWNLKNIITRSPKSGYGSVPEFTSNVDNQLLAEEQNSPYLCRCREIS